MERKLLKIKYIILIFTIIQSYIFIVGINSNEEGKYSEVNTTQIKREMTFKDLDLELSSNRNIEVVELNKNEDNSWVGNIIIKGTYQEVKDSIESLEDYEILNYYIESNKENFNVDLEICK